ncbi:4'-phosphopantetheinyl transferase family protein [Trinickia fusca]|uniref:4'-phosphopantetheinyl transferase family protein n=1 Tax=Trinickia fusca TaxID=2419777 RepID=UPI001FE95B4E|nr:4'-phosphopantetheinyl transferase superfamily protein [Trinickia fusca]
MHNDRSPFETIALDVPHAQAAGVELLRVSIDMHASLDARAYAVLADDEQARAARFLRREDALRHAAGRAALREALAARLAVPAHALRFVSDTTGRPRLAAPWDEQYDFNLSHAGEYALIALSRRRRVGVDIEAWRDGFDWRSVADSTFGPRDRAYVDARSPEAHREAFYAVWTAKEALLKALGAGMAVEGGMTGFSVLGANVDVPDVHLTPVPARVGVSGVDAYEARWCVAPAGYSACVAWSREALR